MKSNISKIFNYIIKIFLNRDIRNSIIATLLATAILGCLTIFFKNRNSKNSEKEKIARIDSIKIKDTLNNTANKKILTNDSNTFIQNPFQKLIQEGEDLSNLLKKNRNVDEAELQKWVNRSLSQVSKEDEIEYNKMKDEHKGNPPQKNIIDKILEILYKNELKK